jgi:hypothetical protein
LTQAEKQGPAAVAQVWARIQQSLPKRA